MLKIISHELYMQRIIIALTIGPPSETTGEVKGFSLIYSGNFLFEAELSEMGRLRLNMGIHPMGFQWYLKKGKASNRYKSVENYF